jgi:hypothetical protein
LAVEDGTVRDVPYPAEEGSVHIAGPPFGRRRPVESAQCLPAERSIPAAPVDLHDIGTGF